MGLRLAATLGSRFVIRAQGHGRRTFAAATTKYRCLVARPFRHRLGGIAVAKEHGGGVIRISIRVQQRLQNLLRPDVMQ
jgi:hypothetical protein